MVIIIIVLPLPKIVIFIIGYSDYNFDALTALAEPLGKPSTIFFRLKLGIWTQFQSFLSKLTKPTKGVKTLGEIGQKSGLDQQTGKMMMKKKIGRMTKGGEPRWLPRWSQL